MPFPRDKFVSSFVHLIFFLGIFFFGQMVFLVCPKNGSAESNGQKINASHHLSPDSFLQFPLEFQDSQNGRLVIRIRDGYQLTYTLQPNLQQRVEKVFKKYRVPYGAFVALEPKTGRILAMTAYSSRHRINPQRFCLKATFPAASLFKLVTAAAALDLGRLDPESRIGYRGNMYKLTPAKLNGSLKRGRYRTSLAEALGRSNNVAFAKVAVGAVGGKNLEAYTRAFGFNRSLIKELPLEVSEAYVPRRSYALGRCGAGLGKVKLSPLHAAMLAAAIANDGEMMAPYLVEDILDAEGERVYQAYPLSLSRPISSETSETLAQMMQETIRIGTSRRAFTSSRGKPYFPEMDISGKTGTLRGNDPPGRYSWFVGFAPSKNPQIVLSALVINRTGGKIRIKGSDLARIALQGFFPGEEKSLGRMVEMERNGGKNFKASNLKSTEKFFIHRARRSKARKTAMIKRASHTKKKKK